jgi:hypothetical protein
LSAEASRLRAEEQTRLRTQADAERFAAEKAKADAERAKQEAQDAALNAERSKREAEEARQSALAQQQQLAAETSRARKPLPTRIASARKRNGSARKLKRSRRTSGSNY